MNDDSDSDIEFQKPVSK